MNWLIENMVNKGIIQNAYILFHRYLVERATNSF